MTGGERQRLRPSPPPLDVDLGRIMLAGTVVWAVALAVCAVLAFLDVVATQVPVVCVAGMAFGGYGVWWSRRRARRQAPDPTSDLPA